MMQLETVATDLFRMTPVCAGVMCVCLVLYRASDIDLDTNVLCAYWNSTLQSWATDGMVLLGMQLDPDNSSMLRVGCASMHLTSFVIASAAGESVEKAVSVCCSTA